MLKQQIQLLLALYALLVPTFAVENSTSKNNEYENPEDLTWPVLPLPLDPHQPLPAFYVHCNPHPWGGKASSYIIARAAMLLEKRIPNSVILYPYRGGAPQRIYCYKGDAIWIQNWEAIERELSFYIIAGQLREIVGRCCGVECNDLSSLHTGGVKGAYIITQVFRYGLTVASLPHGQKCEDNAWLVP